jgi:hypothetical protein
MPKETTRQRQTCLGCSDARPWDTGAILMSAANKVALYSSARSMPEDVAAQRGSGVKGDLLVPSSAHSSARFLTLNSCRELGLISFRHQCFRIDQACSRRHKQGTGLHTEYVLILGLEIGCYRSFKKTQLL